MPAAKARKPRPKFRASWRGQLRFGLVSFEVQAINAELEEKADVHFHLLHAPDHERIHYAKICPKHGEVPNDEIIEGYELKKGKYVEFEKEELDALRTAKERALTVDAFVAAEDIDPIYFDGRMYFLIPSGSGASEPYSLLAAAMEKKNRWGVGQVVFSGREQLAAVRAVDGLLMMAMLNYDNELRKPGDLKSEIKQAHTTSRKAKLAEDLISKWQDASFDISDYSNRYQDKVKQAIQAKAKGHEVAAPEEEEPEVINLMDALQRSVAEVGSKRPRRPTKQRRASSRKTRTTRRRRA